MALMIDPARVCEIQLSDGKWYKLEPGSFMVDNLYYGNNDHFPARLATSPDVEETMGFMANEKGTNTILCGRLGEIKAHRVRPPA